MIKLSVNERNLQDKPQSLRREGFIPGIIYGNELAGQPIKIKRQSLLKAEELDGEVYTVSCARKKYHAKIHNIQRDPVSHEPIHISLINLNNKEKNEINIPIQFTGSPEGLKEGGVFVPMKESIDVEGLLTDLPDVVEVDTSKMNIGDNIHVSDLNLGKKVSVKEEDDEVIAVCQPPIKEEVEEPEQEIELTAEEAMMGDTPAESETEKES